MKKISLGILATITALFSGCAFSFNFGDGMTVLSYTEEAYPWTENALGSKLHLWEAAVSTARLNIQRLRERALEAAK